MLDLVLDVSNFFCARLGLGVLALCFVACEEPPLHAGAWRCGSAELEQAADGSVISPGKDSPLVPDWSTSFEDGFCGYLEARGFCYAAPDASYRLVEFPARTGRVSAAFSITSEANSDGTQTRCVREGMLPEDAYYGAWFYIPSGNTSTGNWNLIHFRGSKDGDLRGLWDVSINTADTGALRPFVRDNLNGGVLMPQDPVEVPRDAWFALHFRLLRASTPTGRVELYVNGQLVVDRTDIITDDSTWGQWYVGNLADALNPPQSTIYVDDVTIGESLPNQF